MFILLKKHKKMFKYLPAFKKFFEFLKQKKNTSKTQFW